MKINKFPETSKIAHDNKTDDSKQRDYDRILKGLSKISSGHYEDISNAMGERELNVVSRRLGEMVKKGMIENTGIKKRTSRNCSAFIYKLCEVAKSPTEIVDDIITLAHKPKKEKQIIHNPLFD